MLDITDTGLSLKERTAVALGIFDGVHRGHRRVLGTAFAHDGLRHAVFTFTTDTVDSKGKDYKMLITDAYKRKLLERAGAEYLFSPDFTKMRTMPAEDFARDILKGRLGARICVCGEKFRFGYNREGDSEALKEYGRKFGFEVQIVPRLDEGGERISSSLIRKLVSDGDIIKANRLLGYNYGYCLNVSHGNEIGRTWSLPTINQYIPKGLVLPKYGVYCSGVHIGDRLYAGVTNIGVKPSVEENSAPLCETHIIGFEGDLYGKDVEIELYEFIRPEIKFESIDELKAVIKKNTEYAKRAFLKYNN